MLGVQNPALDDTVLPFRGTVEGGGPSVSWTDALPCPPFLGPYDPYPLSPPPHTLTAGRAGEAGVVVEVPHGLAGLAGPKHPFAALHTGSCKGENTAVNQEGTVEAESQKANDRSQNTHPSPSRPFTEPRGQLL